MASRRLSLSTHHHKYASVTGHHDQAKAGDPTEDRTRSPTLAQGSPSLLPSIIDPADYPPKGSKWLPPRPASPASAAGSLPPPFYIPWRNDPAYLHHHLPRRLLAVALAMAACLSVAVLGAAFDVPVLGFARSFGLFNPGRFYDLEESWRWQGVVSSRDDDVPFLLARFGYPSSSRSARDGSDPEPIPSILHLVPPGKGVFSYLQWLSIVSGVTQIAPERTIAHMFEGSVPARGTNFWWDETVRLPGLEVREVPDVTEVFGRPVTDISHKADVVRMQVLRDYGGIYLDTDVLVLRNFDELLTGRDEVVMGVEKAQGTLVDPVKIEGLCNAVMVAKKGARFIEKWFQEYTSFRGRSFYDDREGSWNYHSVQLPWLLAKNASANWAPVTVLDHRAFFSPLWDEVGLRWVHGTIPPPPSETAGPSPPSPSPSTPADLPPPPSSRFRFALADLDTPLSSDFGDEDPIADREKELHGPNAPDSPGWSFSTTDQFAYHMWHTLLKTSLPTVTDGAIKKGAGLGPEDALERDSSFNRVARRYLTQEVVARWRSFREREKMAEERRKGRQSFRDWGPLQVRNVSAADPAAVDEPNEAVGAVGAAKRGQEEEQQGAQIVARF